MKGVICMNKSKKSKAEEYVSFVEKLKTMWEDAYFDIRNKTFEQFPKEQQKDKCQAFLEVLRLTLVHYGILSLKVREEQPKLDSV